MPVDSDVASSFTRKKGFTLVELLISIAVISILAAIVYLALDPAKKKGQARDTSRKSGVAQISGALTNYFVQIGSYPNLLSDLVPGELKSLIKDPDGNDFDYSAQNQSGMSCTTDARNCVRAVLYSIYEYPNTACAAGTAYWGWTSSSMRTGKICSEDIPTYEDIPIDD